MNVVVYCGSSYGSDPAFAEAATALGTWIGESGNRLVYGGSSIGCMGLVSSACLAAGGEVYGVEPHFFIEQGVAQMDLTRLYDVETMSERKAKMIELGDVFVALPGGIGTMEEITEVMVRVHLKLGPQDRCFLLNANGFYDPFVELLDSMVEKGLLALDARESYRFPSTVGELTDELAALQKELGL